MKKPSNYLLMALAFWLAGLSAVLLLHPAWLGAWLLLALLVAITWWLAARASWPRPGPLAILVVASFLLRLFLAGVLHYANLNPFGGGADFESYQQYSVAISHHLWQGDPTHYGHDFPWVVAVFYVIFGADPSVGMCLEAWFFAMAVLLVFLLCRQLNMGFRSSWTVAAALNLYPSYLFFGSELLKDTLIIPLALSAVLLSVRLNRKLSWWLFAVLVLDIAALIHFRFYVGFAAMFGFIISWFLASTIPWQKRMQKGLLLALIMGLAPVLAAAGPFTSWPSNYFGYATMEGFLNPQKITLYREISYNPASPDNEDLPAQAAPGSVPSGSSSSFVVKTGLHHGIVRFVENWAVSCFYTLFGPFPWQLRYGRQYVALAETIPWYLFWAGAVWAAFRLVREGRGKKLLEMLHRAAPFWAFSFMALGALALFINNYGIIVRIRIPMCICLGIILVQIIATRYGNLLSDRIGRIYRFAFGTGSVG